MQIDHVTLPKYKGFIHEEVKGIGFHYGPDYYIKVSSTPCLYLRSKNVTSVTSFPGISISPFDKKREKRIKAHFEEIKNEGFFVTQSLQIPKPQLEILKMLDPNLPLSEGDWVYKEEETKLLDNITHITGLGGSGKTTLYNKLKHLKCDIFDTDDVCKKYGWDQNKINDFIKEYEVSKKKVIFLGITIPYLKKVALHRYILDVPLKVIYQRLMLRLLNAIVDHKDGIKSEITEHTEDAWGRCTDKYDITQQFLEPYKKWETWSSYMVMRLESQGYVKMSGDELYERLG